MLNVQLASEAQTALDGLERVFKEDTAKVVSRALVFTFKRQVSMARWLVYAPTPIRLPLLVLPLALVGLGFVMGRMATDFYSPLTSAALFGLAVGIGLNALVARETSRYWLRADEQIPVDQPPRQ